MKKLTIILLVACCVTSCRKFLKEYSQSDVVPTTTKHFSEILNMDGYPAPKAILHNFSVFLDDDVQCYWGPTLGEGAIFARPAAPLFQWQPNVTEILLEQKAPFLLNAWNNYYKLILGTNVVIQFVNDSEGSQMEKDRVRGEAYGLRAFYHFMLVNIYAAPYNDSTTTPDKLAGVPIRTSAELSDEYLGRNTVKEVYEQIEKDLDSAIVLLRKDRSSRSVTRMSHVAAHHLASRVYLYEEKWEKAVAHADSVIKYHPQLMELNSWGGMPMPETQPLSGPRNIESVWCYGSADDKLAPGYRDAYELSYDLVNTFEPADLRAMTGFYYNPPDLRFLFATDFSQQKVISALSGGGELYDYFHSWRSAEAYLNRAEALIQLYRITGNQDFVDKALNSLNTLRASRIESSSFVDWTLKPGDELLQMCREERRRELYLEEMHRWFDLRRYGMPSIKHYYRPDELTTEVYVLEARDRQYVMPIPQEVLDRNPALTQNPQRSGTRMPQ